MKISKLVMEWLEYKKNFVKPSTISTYYSTIKNSLIPYFGNIDIKDVTNKMAQEFILESVKTDSVRMASEAIKIIKMIMEYSYEIYGEPEIIQFRIKYPPKCKGDSKKLDVYTESEQKAIINYAMNNMTYKNLGILIALCTGMRIGEICALKWHDINIEQKCIHVRSTLSRITDIDCYEKTKIEISDTKTICGNRDIPITQDLLQVLKVFKKVLNDNFFVLTNAQVPTEPNIFRNYYKRIIKNEIKLSRCLKFHGLRHTFATRMISSGVDIKTASVILGHSDVSITMNVYVHPTVEDKRSAVTKSLKKLFI